MISQAELMWQYIIEKGTRRATDFKDQLYLQPGATDDDFQLALLKQGIYLNFSKNV